MQAATGRRLHDMVGAENEKRTQMCIKNNDARQLAGIGAPPRDQRPKATEKTAPREEPNIKRHGRHRDGMAICGKRTAMLRQGNPKCCV